MQVRELKEALSIFNDDLLVEVAVPQMGQEHSTRALDLVGHIHHPGEIQLDPSIHSLDIICDHWHRPTNTAGVATVHDLLERIGPYPDDMHVRIGVPLDHDDWTHRMIDIVMVGRMVGSAQGPKVQLITENWDYTGMVVKEKPEAVARRAATVAEA